MSTSHCAEGHTEILYWEADCPFCAHIKATEEARSKLEEKISRLEGDIEDAGCRIEHYRAELGL
jgi:hypothetical protein